MADKKLKQVHVIGQRYKDIVYGFTNIIQSQFPEDDPYFNIIEDIRNLILLYFSKLFLSSMLSEDEEKLLIQLFTKHNKLNENIFGSWNLIFCGSKDGFQRDTFIKKVHDKSKVIIFIKSSAGNIFGGYTEIGWDKQLALTRKARLNDITYSADKDAFVFSIKSTQNDEPCILMVKQTEDSISEALGYGSHAYGCFGDIWIFYIRFDEELNKNRIRTQWPSNYKHLEKHHDRDKCFFCGTYQDEDIDDIEVFQLCD